MGAKRMPKNVGNRHVKVQLSDELYAALMQRARAGGVTVSRCATELLQAGLGVMRDELVLPGALKADLEDAALEHGISLNEEIVRRLLSPQKVYRAGMSREQWNAMMELEPLTSDPNVPISEVVAAMEEINPYRGPHKTDIEADADELDKLDIDAEIEWLNPEKSWYTHAPEDGAGGNGYVRRLEHG